MNTVFLPILFSMALITSLAVASNLTGMMTATAQTEDVDRYSTVQDGGNMTMTATKEAHDAEAAIVRDSVFADLSGKMIPAGDFMHFYDTTPYKIMNGHVAAKLPCDEQSETPIQILIGPAPNMTSAELDLIPELSSPGQLCMYHTDLHSAHGNHTGTAGGRPITDVAITNPTSANITFPETSTLVIGVNEIMPLEEEEHMH